MSRTIYKYTLKVEDEQTLEVPADALPLSVQVQNGEPQLWALVTPMSGSLKKLRIRTFGTGHRFDMDRGFHFIGTYQLYGGGLVCHVFTEIF